MSDRFSPFPFHHYATSPAPQVAPPPAEPVEPAGPDEGDGEPWGLLDLEDPPEAYGVDEVTVLWRDPATLFAHWEVTAHGHVAAERTLGQTGTLILRLELLGRYVDEPLPRAIGRGYVRTPRAGVKLRGAIGLRAPSGAFVAIAWAPEVAVPPDNVAPAGSVEWMTVNPGHGPPDIVGVVPGELPELRPAVEPSKPAPSSPAGGRR